MTRERLFRGKILGPGRWVYGDLLTNKEEGKAVYKISPNHEGIAFKVGSESVGELICTVPNLGRIWEGGKVKITFTDYYSCGSFCVEEGGIHTGVIMQLSLQWVVVADDGANMPLFDALYGDTKFERLGD